MSGKIFYRERRKIGEKERAPRFRVVAVAGADVKFAAEHMRKQELEQIAAAVGAELVALEVECKEEGHRGEGGHNCHRA